MTAILFAKLSHFSNSFNYRVIGLLYRTQVAKQTQPKSPHSQIKERPHRNNYRYDDIQPFMFKRTSVGSYRHKRIIIQT